MCASIFRGLGLLPAWLVERVPGWTLLLLMLQATVTFAGGLEVIGPLPEAPGDSRYDHYWRLLARALTVTEPDFGLSVLKTLSTPKFGLCNALG